MTTQQHAFNDILNLPSGAKWLKADLHVHTPGSKDIDKEYKNATPQDVVNAALDKGLDIIAVTDHNTISWCDKVREAAKGTPLTVFPGVEISTSQGHLLALFDVDTTTKKMNEFLVSVDFVDEHQGDLEFSTQKKIDEVASIVAKQNGIAIAAHAEKKNGFLKSITNARERRRVYSSQDLWAVELVDITDRSRHQSGELFSAQRKMTCLQFSDSHKLDKDMAKRHTFLKMAERSINGLKLALLDPDIRVRLPQDPAPTPECTILGLWVTNGFLDGQKMRFNAGVNCLIGNTGSGKSLTIELIRFALDQTPIVEKIHEETTSLLTHQMRNQGRVHVLVEKGETSYLIERTWEKNPNPPYVQRINSDGSLEDVEIPTIQEFFPAKCFSQSEIIEFSRDQTARLSLVDDLIEIAEELTSIDDTKNELKRNGANTLSTQSEIKTMREQIAERTTLAEELKRIDEVLPQSRIDEQELWHKEQQIFAKAREQTNSLPDAINQSMTRLTLQPQPVDQFSNLPNKDKLDKLITLFQKWNDYVTKAQDSFQRSLRNLTNSYDDLHKNWLQLFDAKEKEFKAALEALDTEGRGYPSLAKRRRTIQRNINTLNQKEQELTETVIPKLNNLDKEREILLDKLLEYRNSVTDKRDQKTQELSQKLNHKIRVKIHPRYNKTPYQNELKSITEGARLYEDELANLSNYNPIPLVKYLIRGDFQTLHDRTRVNIHKLEKMRDTIYERNRITRLYDLQLIDLEDTIEVQLEVQQGDYKNLEELSHGQKCMVVLLIAQAEGDSPLLVDQPEDALHAPSIEEGIVTTLRSQRNSRQCIFATRSANILVSADSDQIIALESNAAHGHVSSTGALDNYNHRKLVVHHVEGGEEAFRRRKTLYDLKHPAENGP